MDVRGQLVKQAISHFWYGVSHDIFSEPVTTYAKLAIEALKKENDATVQEWISVKDRLPEHGDVVLCFMKFGEQRILQWDNVSNWWLGYGHGDDWQKADVTHWQPMPQPPKGE